MKQGHIELYCNACRRTQRYDRDIDPNIPTSVATIVYAECDDCWDGYERQGETWLDANGKEVPQTS